MPQHALAKKIVKLGFHVAEHTNALLAYWDKDCICRFANASYMEWFGISPEDLIDKKHISELLGPLYTQNLPYINGALKGKMQVFERKIKTADGHYKDSLATYCPDMEKQVVLGFFVHVADVTQLKKHVHNNQRVNVGTNPLNEVNHQVYAVEKTLHESLLSGFPGIENLCKQHFISPTKLKSDFRKVYNTPVFSYFRMLQMQLAERYIREKVCSKKQLAAMLNFSNPSNFYACYKKYSKSVAVNRSPLTIRQPVGKLYEILVNECPYPMAMLDEDMRFIFTSQTWRTAFMPALHQPENESFTRLLPAVAAQLNTAVQNAKKGLTSCGEDVFIIDNAGVNKWLKWNIKPWHYDNNQVGGIIVCLEDITAIKTEREEDAKIFEILRSTSEIARIGAWKRNFKTNTAVWNNITKEILEVPANYLPELETSINFYKQGADRQLIEHAIYNATHHNTPFDIVASLITAKGTEKKVRVIGYPVFKNGKCEKLLGTFQDLSVKPLTPANNITGFPLTVN